MSGRRSLWRVALQAVQRRNRTFIDQQRSMLCSWSGLKWHSRQFGSHPDADLEFYSPVVQEEMRRVNQAQARTLPLVPRFPSFDPETKHRFVDELENALERQLRLLERLQRSEDPKAKEYAHAWQKMKDVSGGPEGFEERLRGRNKVLRKLAHMEEAVQHDAQQVQQLRDFQRFVTAIVWQADDMAKLPGFADAVNADLRFLAFLNACFQNPVSVCDQSNVDDFNAGKLGPKVWEIIRTHAVT